MAAAMHTHIVTGAASAGSSTVAAALAAALAASGERVAYLHGEQDAAPDLAGVAAVPIRPLAWAERAWDSAAQLRRLAGDALARLGPGDMLPLPGLAELAWWGTLRSTWSQSSYSAVVVDAGAIGQAVPMLTVPDTVTGGLRRVWPLGQRSGHAAGAPGDAWHRFAMERLDAEAGDLAARLRSAATSLHLVTRPADHEVARVLRQVPVLALFELPVRQVVINHYSARRHFDKALHDHLSAALPGVRLATARGMREAPDPGGAAAELFPPGWAARLRDAGLGRPKVSRVAEEYRWRWTLPFADTSGATVAVDQDEAVLTVGAARRVVRLPSVLRRCTIVAAEAAGSTLTARFVPDRSVWPASWEVS